jgi:3-hydroxyisobutyrate dehydrogenase-like beta-hydroxyacid dehydrogenase
VERIYDAVEHGGGRSALLSAMREGITTGRVDPSPNLLMHGKDVDYVVQESSRSHAFTPLAATISEVWKLARLQGHTQVASKDMFLVWEEIYGRKLAEGPGR